LLDVAGNFYFTFVLTSLSYITIPKDKRKTELSEIKKLTTTYAPLSSIHKLRTDIICNTFELQKVVCPYKGLLSEENEWNVVSEEKWFATIG